MMNVTRRLLTFGVVLALMGLGACGDDGETASTDAGATPTPDGGNLPGDTGLGLDTTNVDTTTGPDVPDGCSVAAPDQTLCEGVVCEGATICIGGDCVAQPGAGDLVITEIFYNPPSHDLGQEWFEVKNTSDHDVTLRGMTVSNDDGSETFTVAALTRVPAGCHSVIAQDGASVTGGAASSWKGEEAFYLQNTRDQIVLTLDGVEVDRVAYDQDLEWPSANGVSISLDPAVEAGDNNDPAGWCFGVDSFEATTPDGAKTWSKGSPGAANAACDFDCYKYDCTQRPDECVDNLTLKSYSGDGTCVPNEGCDFSAVTSTVDCPSAYGASFVCQQGACVDPCDGLLCNSPPADECEGNNIVSYAANGTCSAGSCSYPVAGTTECGGDVCSTAMGPASCVDASLAGVQLTGYRIQLLQNGETPDDIKFEIELSGDFSHGSYIVVARHATLVSWPTMFTPALDGVSMANVSEFYTTDDTWQFNSLDDPVRILDPNGAIVDMGSGVKNGVHRRQADGYWLQVEDATTSGASGAPASVTGVTGPLYLFEFGEACGECQLTDYNGNYVIVYVP